MLLNKAQTQELAKFFFDRAKGLILGGIGFAAVTPIEIRIVMGIVSAALAYASIRVALSLLKGVK